MFMLFPQKPASIPGINPHYYAIVLGCVSKEICTINEKMQMSSGNKLKLLTINH